MLILPYFCKYFDKVNGSYSLLTFKYSYCATIVVRMSPVGIYINK
jgi:hypothetical protein